MEIAIEKFKVIKEAKREVFGDISYFMLKTKYKRERVEIIELERDIKEVEGESSEGIAFIKEGREKRSNNTIEKAIDT